MPLGGCGEVGLNMTVVEYGEDILVVDCGQMFPEEDMLGIDLVIPDFGYLKQNRDRVRGIILTHGHEDHIGALPYVLPSVRVPVYGTRLTLALVRDKLRESGLDTTTTFMEVKPRNAVEIGKLSVEWIPVTHSLPDAAALAITTPAGVVIHSGDFKIDPNPIDGRHFDFYRLAEYGEGGVQVLLSDSTNVERSGTSPSESSLVPVLDQLIEDAERSVILATFASSLHRVQTIMNLAARRRKRLFVAGMSMASTIEIASELGYLDIPRESFCPLEDLVSTVPEDRVILTTGSQGEALSALSRMALGDHRHIQIAAGDLVILSSRIIPGNERPIFRMINHLFKRGARVVYERTAEVHASGHAFCEEMKSLINLVRPRYFIPVHGELRHLTAHRDLAVEMGLSRAHAMLLENGRAWVYENGKASIQPLFQAGRTLVDGKGIGDVHGIVLRDRQHLAQDGMFIVVLAIDRSSNRVVAGPEIITRGTLYVDENEALLNGCKQVILKTIEDSVEESRGEWSVMKAEVRRAVKRYLKREIRRFPVILPVVVEI
ncbi:ribonuclease J [candidate division BRC1 bacterium SM23_51]|nr:MAG: ribonuclease J [candidate division BRC1 bacterium SM23_51]